MDFAMSCFKMKLLKLLATTNTFPFSQENNVKVWLDHFWAPVNNIDQGGVRGGVNGTKSTGQAFCGWESAKFLYTFCPRLKVSYL